MIEATMKAIGANARRASAALNLSSGDTRNAALLASAAAIRSKRSEILAANAADMAAGVEQGLSGAMLDRLMLDESRIEAMAAGLETVAALHDPTGR
ncbi:MAG: gamma-glutamyl-phosphate reductase, partial [Gammaproteobacteria bacterium]|nr:gamma-glutamyl-phosphate reductase [Gammaproteobacteria bacterium]